MPHSVQQRRTLFFNVGDTGQVHDMANGHGIFDASPGLFEFVQPRTGESSLEDQPKGSCFLLRRDLEHDVFPIP